MTNSASADQAEQVAGVEVGEARITIPGMSEEGENLATAHEETEHSHGGLGESTVKAKSGGSRADRTTSLNVADFAVPTGREEEWRFSPLKKLGRVLSDAATQTPVTLKVRNTATGVTHGELALAQSPRGTVFLAADRAAVVGYSQTQTADHIKVAANTELSEPIFLDITGEAAGHRANGHIVLEAGNHSKAVFVMEHRAPPMPTSTWRSSCATAPTSPWSRCSAGTRTPSTWASRTPRSAATRSTSTSRSPWAARSSG